MKKNISLPNFEKTYSGTIDDGVSKLLILIESNQTLKLLINGTNPKDMSNGTNSSLHQSELPSVPSSSAIAHHINISIGKSVAVIVYTPPNYIDLPKNNTYRTVYILSDNPNGVSYILIKLYRVPVVLIHRIWIFSSFMDYNRI